MVAVENLFNLFSKNLEAFDSKKRDLFKCPLCLCYFGRESIQKNELSREHIIPKFLGGKTITLTCAVCNKKFGSKIDSFLNNKFLMYDCFSGKSNLPQRAKIKIEDGGFGADVFFRDDGAMKEIEIIEKPSTASPKNREKAYQGLKKAGYKMNLETSFSVGQHQPRIAILKIAYLLMFHRFGYGYILNENLQLVHEQFNKLDCDLVASESVIKREKSPEIFGVSVLTEPMELKCFFVTLDLSTDSVKNYYDVILPGLSPEDWRIYEKMKSIFSSPSSKTLNFEGLPENHCINSNPSDVNLLQCIWDRYFK